MAAIYNKNLEQSDGSLKGDLSIDTTFDPSEISPDSSFRKLNLSPHPRYPVAGCCDAPQHASYRPQAAFKRGLVAGLEKKKMALKVLCQANGLTEWKVVNSLSLAAGRPEEAEPRRDNRPGGGGVA